MIGFPKARIIPFGIISIGGGVKSRPAKRFRLIGWFLIRALLGKASQSVKMTRVIFQKFFAHGRRDVGPIL